MVIAGQLALYFAYCRPFSTLHRPNWLSYTAEQVRFSAVNNSDVLHEDCDRVNGMKAAASPILHSTQMVEWCASGKEGRRSLRHTISIRGKGYEQLI